MMQADRSACDSMFSLWRNFVKTALSKTELVRNILLDIGLDKSPKDVVQILKAQVKQDCGESLVYAQKKRLSEEIKKGLDGEAPLPDGLTPDRAFAILPKSVRDNRQKVAGLNKPAPNDPSAYIKQLRELREYADRIGDVADLRENVRDIQELAEKFGGFQNLEQALDFLLES